MLQFHLLKYLKFYDLIKLQLTCKDGSNMCDANLAKDHSKQTEILLKKTIKKKLKKAEKKNQT